MFNVNFLKCEWREQWRMDASEGDELVIHRHNNEWLTEYIQHTKSSQYANFRDAITAFCSKWMREISIRKLIYFAF